MIRTARSSGEGAVSPVGEGQAWDTMWLGFWTKVPLSGIPGTLLWPGEMSEGQALKSPQVKAWQGVQFLLWGEKPWFHWALEVSTLKLSDGGARGLHFFPSGLGSGFWLLT